MDKKNVRIFFEKKGRAIYISHLDLMRTMQRALKRSGLPVWFTEGFNPRLYLNFPLALSLGITGEREPMDIAVVEEISLDDIADRLNAVCPQGIRIVGAAYSIHPNKDIGSAEYESQLSGDTEELKKALESYLAQDFIKVMKHSKKKGMVEVDIRPHINMLSVSDCDKGIIIRYRLPAGIGLNLNSAVLTDSFAEYCVNNDISEEHIYTKRTNIFCVDGTVFE